MQIEEELLNLYTSCVNRDGSNAFDTLLSIHQYKKLYKISEKYLNKNDLVLDWGCGSGHFSYFLHRKSFNTIAFGFNKPELIEDYISNGEIQFIQGSADSPSKLPFVNYSFDAVFSVGVLEHVREFHGNEIESLEEIYRILKPGGKFICYHFPNKKSYIEYIARKTGMYSHKYLYERDNINNLFDCNKWDLVKISRYGIIPRNIFRKILNKNLKKSKILAHAYDYIDLFLGMILFPIAQNWCIIAIKK
jgi:ubiquinone/menaquinone biosynthesis C-methylase UbiE